MVENTANQEELTRIKELFENAADDLMELIDNPKLVRIDPRSTSEEYGYGISGPYDWYHELKLDKRVFGSEYGSFSGYWLEEGRVRIPNHISFGRYVFNFKWAQMKPKELATASLVNGGGDNRRLVFDFNFVDGTINASLTDYPVKDKIRGFFNRRKYDVEVGVSWSWDKLEKIKIHATSGGERESVYIAVPELPELGQQPYIESRGSYWWPTDYDMIDYERSDGIWRVAEARYFSTKKVGFHEEYVSRSESMKSLNLRFPDILETSHHRELGDGVLLKIEAEGRPFVLFYPERIDYERQIEQALRWQPVLKGAGMYTGR